MRDLRPRFRLQGGVLLLDERHGPATQNRCCCAARHNTAPARARQGQNRAWHAAHGCGTIVGMTIQPPTKIGQVINAIIAGKKSAIGPKLGRRFYQPRGIQGMETANIVGFILMTLGDDKDIEMLNKEWKKHEPHALVRKFRLKMRKFRLRRRAFRLSKRAAKLLGVELPDILRLLRIDDDSYYCDPQKTIAELNRLDGRGESA